MSVSAAPRRTCLRAAGTALLLAGLVLAVYWPVGGYPFAGFDDDVIVVGNPRVNGGLTGSGLAWAFTEVTAGIWHPATWISHMTDVELFGLDAGRHHVTNLLLHAAGTVLLFLSLLGMTGARWRSALVAALFAIHPLHVESVVWIAERKDVLSGLFWSLSLAAYLRYVRRPDALRYLALAGAFALGLMAKPTVVTLPFVLLLLDLWPLGRLRAGWAGGPAAGGRGPAAVLVEKLPLLALSAGAAALTVIAAARSGTVSSVDALPLAARAANAAVAYAWYLLKTVAPTSLAVFYPHPGAAIDLSALGASLALIALLTWLSLRSWPRLPALGVGWLWYLGTLLPTAGLVQVGAFARADRFTYLPLTGIFLMAAWCVPRPFLQGRPLAVRAQAAAAIAAVGALAAAAFVQVGHWRNDETLFTHAIAVTRGNWMMHGNLGANLMDQGRLPEAVAQFRLALRFNPGFGEARLNLAQALALLGAPAEAERVLEEEMGRNPADARAHFLLGRHLAAQGRPDEAIARLGEALRLNPGLVAARETLATLLEESGRGAEAARLRADGSARGRTGR